MHMLKSSAYGKRNDDLSTLPRCSTTSQMQELAGAGHVLAHGGNMQDHSIQTRKRRGLPEILQCWGPVGQQARPTGGCCQGAIDREKLPHNLQKTSSPDAIDYT